MLLPFLVDRTVLFSPLSEDEVWALLVYEKQRGESLTLLQGKKDSSSNLTIFKATRTVKGRSSFNPIMTGRVNQHGSGTTIRIEFRLDEFVQVFMTAWLACLCIKIGFDLRDGLTAVGIIPIIMVVFGYFMFFFSYRSEKDKALDLLRTKLKAVSLDAERM